MIEEKRVLDSHTQQVQIVMSAQINGAGRLFGGMLVEWIDVVAAVARPPALQPQRDHRFDRQPAI